jgi:hypothetical protein
MSMLDSPDPVHVRYEASDYRALTINCPKCRANLLLLFLLPAAAVLIVEIELNAAASIDWGVVGSALIVGAMIASFFFIVTPLFQVRAQRKAGFVEPIEYALEEEGVWARHPRQDSLFRWTGMHSVRATSRRLFLFTQPSCAIILPRRCFSSDEQFDRWSAEAKRRFNAA